MADIVTEKKTEKTNAVNNIKLGTFQLQTKSFWISLVCILTLFITGMVWINVYTYNKFLTEMFSHEEEIIKIIYENLMKAK